MTSVSVVTIAGAPGRAGHRSRHSCRRERGEADGAPVREFWYIYGSSRVGLGGDGACVADDDDGASATVAVESRVGGLEVSTEDSDGAPAGFADSVILLSMDLVGLGKV
mmetsp:Transcript_31554/g.94418  ORF Transcript_31554/g.94418 Transcript_31554/m.94418 type:complete len:109 (+) Transcript_31554:1311-1637(+)